MASDLSRVAPPIATDPVWASTSEAMMRGMSARLMRRMLDFIAAVEVSWVMVEGLKKS